MVEKRLIRHLRGHLRRRGFGGVQLRDHHVEGVAPAHTLGGDGILHVCEGQLVQVRGRGRRGAAVFAAQRLQLVFGEDAPAAEVLGDHPVAHDELLVAPTGTRGATPNGGPVEVVANQQVGIFGV